MTNYSSSNYSSSNHPSSNYSTCLKTLDITQRKAIKIALGVPKDAPTNIIYAESKVLPVSSINKVHTCLFMVKYSNSKLPATF